MSITETAATPVYEPVIVSIDGENKPTETKKKTRVKKEPNPNTVQRLAKVEILKPINCSWETAGKVLRSVERACIDAANFIVTTCLARDRDAFASIIFNSEGERILPKAPRGKKDTSTTTVDDPDQEDQPLRLNLPAMDVAVGTQEYHMLRQLFPHVSSNIISCINESVKKKYMQTRTQVILGRRSAEHYRNYSIPIHNQRWRMFKDEKGNYTIQLSLLSQDAKGFLDNEGNPLTSLVFALKTSKIRGFEQKAFDKLAALPIAEPTGLPKIRKEIKIKNNRLGKKWMVLIPYDREKEERDLIQGRVMQVLPYKQNGLVSCYCEMPAQPFVEDIECSSVIKFHGWFHKYRNEINLKYRQSNKGKGPKSGSVGHGRQRAMRKSVQLKRSYNNMVECYNRQKASYIVKLAIRWRCAQVSMINLSELDKDSLALKDWRYSDLIKYISDLCEENRITFELVSKDQLDQMQAKLVSVVKNKSSQTLIEVSKSEVGELVGAQ